VKHKILIVGDSPFVNTGFSYIHRELGKYLYNNDYQIESIGLWDKRPSEQVMTYNNHYIPWNVYICRDNFQKYANTYQKILDIVNPTLIIIITDLWIAKFFIETTIPKIYYFHVEGGPLPFNTYGMVGEKVDWIKTLLKNDLVVFAGEFGKKTTLDGFRFYNKLYKTTINIDELDKKWPIIPNGVNTEIFYPLDRRSELKKELWKINPDSFVIGFFSRMNARKGLPYALEAFSKWPGRPQNAYFYCHCAINDKWGWDLVKMTMELGIEDKVIVNKDFKVGDGVSYDMLNKLYNACNIICLPPKSKIITSSGIKNIENIKINDKVITHKGRFSSVKNTFKRQVNEKLYIIKPHYFPEFKLTGNHPVLAIKGNKCHLNKQNRICNPMCDDILGHKNRSLNLNFIEKLKTHVNMYKQCILLRKNGLGPKKISKKLQISISTICGWIYKNLNPVRRLEKIKNSTSCSKNYYKNYKIEWIPANNLIQDDILVFPNKLDSCDIKYVDTPKYINDTKFKNNPYQLKKLPNKVKVNSNLLKIIGYYITEGCANNGEIIFSLNSNEQKYAKEITKSIKKLFNLAGTLKYHDRNRMTIHFYSVLLDKFLSDLCGKHAKNKRIPDVFINLPNNKLKILLDTLFNGDGYISKKHRNITYTTISELLAYQVQYCLLKFGILSSFIKKTRGEYTVTILNEYLSEYKNLINNKITIVKTNKKQKSFFVWRDKDYTYINIRNIKKVKYNGYVHNLEVENDNSYSTNGCVFHNCSPSLGEGFGQTTCLKGNAMVKMKNGYKKIQDIEKGEYVATHMGRYQKVLETSSTPYKGDICEISTYDSPAFYATPTHRMLSLKKDIDPQTRRGKFGYEAQELCGGDLLKFPVFPIAKKGLKKLKKILQNRKYLDSEVPEIIFKHREVLHQPKFAKYNTIRKYGKIWRLIINKDKKIDISRSHGKYKKSIRYILSKIKKVKKVPFKGLVYNLVVEDDHSFLVNGVTAVHNCQALATGTPVIITNYSELKNFDRGTMKIEPIAFYVETGTNIKRAIPGIEDLWKCYDKAFKKKINHLYKEARDGVIKYDWSNVGPMWIKLINSISMGEINNDKKVSIIIPVYNSDTVFLEKAINSVLEQTYTNIELIVVDDASTQKYHFKILDKYKSNIKTIYLDSNVGVAQATTKGIEIATGDYIGFLDHDDMLKPVCVEKTVEYLNSNKDIGMVYTDEDKVNESDKVTELVYKEDYNEDLLLSMMYINHFRLYKSNLLKEFLPLKYDGAQDFDLTLKFSEKYKIGHIRNILYDWRINKTSTLSGMKDDVANNNKTCVEDALKRRNINANVLTGPMPTQWHIDRPLKIKDPVSIIILTKDKLHFLENCINSIEQYTLYPHEIIIVDTGSKDQATFDYYSKSKHRILNDDFHFSKSNNKAIERATYNNVVFLNNDIYVTENWLEEIMKQLQRLEVGIVGPKLLFPNETIQHAGLALGLGGLAGHMHIGKPKNYFATNFIREVNAVTGACLAIKKDIFRNVGGFDIGYMIEFQDVDLCCHPDTIVVGNHIKKITEYIKNDIVYNSKGKQIKILECMKRLYNGNMINIQPFYSETLKFTPQHPILIKRNDVIMWEKAENIKKDDKLHMVIPNIKNNLKYINVLNYIKYMPNIHKINNNIITYRKTRKSSIELPLKIKLDENFAILMGLYLSEGHIDKKIQHVTYTLSENEYIDKLIGALNYYKLPYYRRITQKHKNITTYQITVTSRLLSELLFNICGRISDKKEINADFINTNSNFMKQLIKWMYIGDGNKTIRYSYTTTSYKLAYFLRTQLLRFKIVSSVKYTSGAFRVEIALNHYNRFYNIVQLKLKNKIKITNKFNFFEETEDCFWISIHDIFQTKYNGYVYNFHTDNDNTYNTHNITVHNCLKVRKLGYKIIYTPHSILYHHCSVTRGNPTQLQAMNDRSLFVEKWKSELEIIDFNLSKDTMEPNYLKYIDHWLKVGIEGRKRGIIKR